MSKRFLTDVIVESTGMPASRAGALAADVVGAIRGEIVNTGRFTLPEFGSFAVRETKARTALNPRTGEPFARPARSRWPRSREVTMRGASRHRSPRLPFHYGWPIVGVAFVRWRSA